MPRTRSAAKQARASLRRRAHNRAIKSHLHTLERRFLSLLEAKNAQDAAEALRLLTSALDKAAKIRVIHSRTASRKKSRLAARINTLTASAPTAQRAVATSSPPAN